ncbi:MAG: copper homeostasis membrane protein CopD [Brevundimonas mediterranea]|nr:MAG: copper resistance protein CopD [Brevundimonas sp.]
MPTTRTSQDVARSRKGLQGGIGMETAIIGLRFVQYGGAMLLFGLPLFHLLRIPSDSLAAAGAPRRLLAAAAALTLVSTLAALATQTAMMGGAWSEALRSEALSYVAFDTGLGLAMLVRAAAALAALGVVLRLGRGRGGWRVLVALGAMITVSLAWMGHGAATQGAGRWAHLAADIVHVLAAALWLGALAALVSLLRQASVSPAGATLAFTALQGFSGMGTLAVGLLTVSGLINAGFIIGPENLAETPATTYGRLLIVKLLLFGLMLALAAGNRFNLTPRLGDALHSATARQSALTILRRSVALETALGAALLLAVAAMGVQPPPGVEM